MSFRLKQTFSMSKKKNSTASKNSTVDQVAEIDPAWQLAEIFLDDVEDADNIDADASNSAGGTRYFVIPTSLESFDNRQKTIIKASWRLLAKYSDEVGVKIYQTIFDCAPAAKRMFHFVQHDSNGEFVINKQARFQASRFMNLFEMIAEAIDDNAQSVIPVLTNLGGIHSKYVVSRGFNDSYWFVFEDSTLIVFRKYLKKASQQQPNLNPNN